MATKIQIRRDTAANWSAANPILSSGEPALETDTNKIKYGDGITTWEHLQYVGDAFTFSGAAEKPVGMREVSGIKSFTFETYGHRWTYFNAYNSLNGSSTITVDASVYPNIKYASQALIDGTTIGYYVNDGWQGEINNVAVNGNIYTLYLTSGTVSCSTGDIIRIHVWSRGTQASYPEYVSGTHLPTTNSSNTNVIRLDLASTNGCTSNAYNLTYFNSGEQDINAVNSLTAFPDKNYIVFNPQDFAYNTRDQRKITHATNVSGTIWDITFDGKPRSAGYGPVSLPVKASKSYTGTILYIAAKNYPQLLTSDPAVPIVVKINGTPVANTVSFYPFNTQDYTMDHYGNYIMNLDTSITYTPADDIELDFTYTDWARIDYYVPNVVDNTSNYYNNAYRWFDWNSDVPHSVDQAGNGVRGGQIQGYVTVYDTETQSTERTMFNNFFDINDDFTWKYPLSSLSYSGSAIAGNFLDEGGYFGDENYIYWDFYEGGIYFAKAPWNEDSIHIGRDIKVDIVYKMTLFIDSTRDNWC